MKMLDLKLKCSKRKFKVRLHVTTKDCSNMVSDRLEEDERERGCSKNSGKISRVYFSISLVSGLC